MAIMPQQKPGKSEQVDQLIGKIFDRLAVLTYSHTNKWYDKYYKCLCSCGKEKVISRQALISGRTRSCKCLLIERAKETKRNKLPDNGGIKNQLFLLHKRVAKHRKIDFLLTKEEHRNIVKQCCYYCGDKPSNYFTTERYNFGIYYSGLDRSDNTKGYTLANVVACCMTCNRAKNDKTLEEFNTWINRLMEYQNATKTTTLVK